MHDPVKPNVTGRYVRKGGRNKRKWYILTCPSCNRLFRVLQNTSKGRGFVCKGDGKLTATMKGGKPIVR